MTDTIRLLRSLYRDLIREAIEKKIAIDAQAFNRLVIKRAGPTTAIAARGGALDAIEKLCDIAEKLVDAPSPPPEGDEEPAGWEEAEWRKHLWNRSCDLHLNNQ